MESPVRIGIDCEIYILADFHFADIRFIYQKFNAHGGKISHAHNHHLAGEPLGYGFPFFHGFTYNYAVHRRSDDCIIHISLGLVIGSLGIQILQPGIVHFLIGNSALAVERIQPVEIGLLVFQRILGLLHGRRKRFGFNGGQYLPLRDLLVLLYIHLFQGARSRSGQIDTVVRFNGACRIHSKTDIIPVHSA